MKRILMISMALAWGVPQAHGQSLDFFINGDQLYSYCSADKNDDEFEKKLDFCYGYLVGIVDEWVAIRRSNHRDSCLPNFFVSEKLKSSVVRFLEVHPELRQYPAADLVTAALLDAYPDCK